jgi:ADP-ribose pyrophosphatase YjhB (NUDIX family)
VIGRVRRLAGLAPAYARIAWWGLVGPRLEGEPLLVVQAAVLGPQGILLSMRSDLWGWELPGGNLRPGEAPEAALRREVREETGLDVELEKPVGDYVRTGFRPHRARVYRCRAVGGALAPSEETPRVAWFPTEALPDTLFAWYRAPIEDALARQSEPVERHDHQGLSTILDAARIDLRTRWRG